MCTVGTGGVSHLWSGSHLRRLVASRRMRRSLSAAPAPTVAAEGGLLVADRCSWATYVFTPSASPDPIRARPLQLVVGSIKIVSKSAVGSLAAKQFFLSLDQFDTRSRDDQNTRLAHTQQRCCFLWQQRGRERERENKGHTAAIIDSGGRVRATTSSKYNSRFEVMPKPFIRKKKKTRCAATSVGIVV